MIRLKDISKIYRPSKDVEVAALKNISIDVDSGDFLALLGKSGSGKSTLMYIIGLLEKPTTGEVYLDNKQISSLSDVSISQIRNSMVGFIFQQFNLIPKLTVAENILLPTAYSESGTTKKKQEYSDYLMKEFGIMEKKNAYPNQLSGGQQQRVAIARALINDPKILIADEPTGNLDTQTGKQIIDLISSIHKDNKKTVLLVTHDNHIAKMSEKTIYITDGRVSYE